LGALEDQGVPGNRDPLIFIGATLVLRQDCFEQPARIYSSLSELLRVFIAPPSSARCRHWIMTLIRAESAIPRDCPFSELGRAPPAGLPGAGCCCPACSCPRIHGAIRIAYSPRPLRIVDATRVTRILASPHLTTADASQDGRGLCAKAPGYPRLAWPIGRHTLPFPRGAKISWMHPPRPAAAPPAETSLLPS
jgi:hypothetical protein